MNNYSESMKYYREHNGYSQNALSKATGISQPKISYYESSQHAPPIDFCITLAKFYGITLDELVGLTDNTENNYSANNYLPTQLSHNVVAFNKEFGELITDKNYINMSKLYNAITPELRALTLGYIVGLLQNQGVNTQKILGY